MLSLNLWASCITLMGCETKTDEPASATPPIIDNLNELPQLPHINVTQTHKWLNFPLSSVSQLTSLNSKKSSYSSDSYRRTPLDCYKSWKLFYHVTIPNWPREHATSNVTFITNNGKVKFMTFQFYELYPFDFAEDSIKNDIGHSLGLVSDLRYRAGKYYAGKYPDALDEISKEIKSKCHEINFQKQEIGYQCKNFAISKLPPQNIFSIGWYLHSLHLESDSQPSVERIIKILEKPSLPLFIEHEHVLDRPTVTYAVYENEEALSEFLTDVANFNDQCTQLL